MLKLLHILLCTSAFILLNPEEKIRISLKKQQSDSSSFPKFSLLRPDSMPTFISSENQIALENFWNQQFVGTIGIGTPPQYLTVIFDTGSGNFFVNSELCESRSCQSREAYDHELSSTYTSLDIPLAVQFGSGIVRGVLGNDTLIMGGIKIPGQNFAEVTYESGSVFYYAKFSAIMGLGFNTLAHDDTVPVFDHIVESKFLEWNVFAFYYSLNEDDESELMIGDVDHSKYHGHIHWVSVTEDPYYWTVLVTDVLFGYKSTGLCKGGCLAAMDTGTTLILAPSEAVDILYRKIENPCDLNDMPDLVFVIDGKRYAIPATSYMISLNRGKTEDPGVHSDLTPDQCYLAISSLDIDPPLGPLWVLGNVFMHSYYVAFDRDKMSVGLARSINQ